MSETPTKEGGGARASASDAPSHVVGIGASAGGLEALEAFFERVPTDTGLAFVVVQHLSPDFKSHMKQLLERATAMPIFRVEDSMRVCAGSIYLIPPKKEMIISGGRLLLTDKDPQQALAHPIDLFFRSLAHDLGRGAIAVVLSGTGSDGSRGIRDVHAAGGLVLVQDVGSARFDGMPLNAQGTGIVDLVLPPGAMPEALVRYAKDPLSPAALAEQAEGGASSDALERLFQLLRGRYGTDFGQYKLTTIGRRVQRRMRLADQAELEDYLARLDSDPAELAALHRDLLVGVTCFFRDTEAFEQLERELVPQILERVEPGEPVRAWVAGCATGEEAYSLAMLFHEQMTAQGRTPRLKLFATDAHRESIAAASAGLFPAAALADLAPERRERWFRQREDGMAVARELRESIVFAVHDLLVDAPFTQLELVSCRNLLIYLLPAAQRRALSLLHFGLRAGGVLFLGPSETPAELADEFQVVDKRWKIFRKRRELRLPAGLALGTGSSPLLGRRAAPAAGRAPEGELLALYDRLLDAHMPPSFLVDADLRLVHTFGGAERYLGFRSGRTTTKLLELVGDDLRPTLAGALAHALKDDQPVRYGALRIAAAGGEEELRLSVHPLTEPRSQSRHLLVQLEASAPRPAAGLPVERKVDDATRERLRSLEAELTFYKENLQATIEELETANEELQAANEELVASNEELQSTNEELHSVNEELFTVNAEHQRKIDELTEATDDMDNLLATTQVGVMFLDSGLRIRRFTPALARNFQLLPQDVGRSIESFSHNLEYPDLIEDVRRVFEGGEPVECEVADRQGLPYFLRVRPYKSRGVVEGIALTLIDIRSVREKEVDLQRFKFISEHAMDMHVLLDAEGRFCYANEAAKRQLGYSGAELLSMRLTDVDERTDLARYRARFERAQREPLPLYESSLVRKDGSKQPVEVSATPVSFEGVPYLFLATREVSERKQAEKRLALGYALATIAAEERTVAGALPRFLKSFVDILETDIAEFWRCGEDGLLLDVIASGSGLEQRAAWEEHARGLVMAKGQGLPGHAWEAGEPVWMDDLQGDARFVRGELARDSGLLEACAFPVVEGGRCHGVVAIFARERFIRSKVYLWAFAAHGRTIGQFLGRLAVEEALRLRNRAMEATADGVILLGPGQGAGAPIVYANRGFERITGYGEAEALGHHLGLLQSEATDTEAAITLEHALAERKECRVTMLNRRKDGTLFWNEMQLSPVFDEDGSLIQFVVVMHDVTDSRQAEHRALLWQRRYEAAAEASGNLLFDWDLGSDEVVYSANLEDVTGYPPEEMAGGFARWLEVVHEQDRALLSGELERVRGGAESLSVDCRVVHADGAVLHCELRGLPVFGSDGEVERVVGFVIDVSERVRGEKELEQARDAAEEANRAKSEFVANMSHEIRTPLSAIMGFTEFLSRRDVGADGEEAIATIQRNSSYLLEILNDILDLSKIEAGMLVVEREPCELEGLLTDVLALMNVRARERGLPLLFRSSGPVPRTILTDRVRMRQVLVNLISNALKFTEEGEVVLEVEYPRSEEPRIRFRVTDTGIGMTAAQMARIFQPFTQVHRDENGYGGTGLGLSITKRLVEALAGEIHVESARGRGSAFTVSVPCGPIVGVELVRLPERLALARSPEERGRARLDCRVLVADDQRDVWRAVRFLLEDAGAEVLVAENGREAIDVLAAEEHEGREVDLVFMDMQMPVMNGYEAVRRLRERGFDKPIVALTAAAMKGERDRCLLLGCTDYLSKPAREDDLISMVATYSRSAVRPVVGVAGRAGRRVLIVEDHGDAARALARLLALQGHSVRTARTGELAIQEFERFRPEVALLDLNLPDMDGRVLLQELKRRAAPDVRFAAVTGVSAHEDVGDAGFDRFLRKPVDIAELRAFLTA